jgi:hypothetical protein
MRELADCLGLDKQHEARITLRSLPNPRRSSSTSLACTSRTKKAGVLASLAARTTTHFEREREGERERERPTQELKRPELQEENGRQQLRVSSGFTLSFLMLG